MKIRRLVATLVLTLLAWAPAQTLTTAILSNPPTLDPQVTLHNGTALDADAVVASFQRILDPKTGAPGRSVPSRIQEVRAVDASTVELVPGPPFAPLLAHLAHASPRSFPLVTRMRSAARRWAPARSCSSAGSTAARSC